MRKPCFSWFWMISIVGSTRFGDEVWKTLLVLKLSNVDIWSGSDAVLVLVDCEMSEILLHKVGFVDRLIS